MIQNANYSSRNDILNVMATGTASGQLVSIMDGAENTPIKNLTIDFEPYQSGSGDPSPSNIRNFGRIPRPYIIKSGKNLFGGMAFAKQIAFAFKGSINENNKNVSFFAGNGTRMAGVSSSFFKPNTQYTFIFDAYKSAGIGLNAGIYYTDNSSESWAISASGVYETIARISESGKTIYYFTKRNQSSTTYLHYDNCGIFEGVHTIDEFEPFVGEDIVIDIPSDLGEYLYGGKIIFEEDGTGRLIINQLHTTVADSNWEFNGTCFQSDVIDNIMVGSEGIVPNALATAYKKVAPDDPQDNSFSISSDGKFLIRDDSFNGDVTQFIADRGTVEILYPLNVAKVYSLPNKQIKTLLGVNNFMFPWNKENIEISLTYRKDISAVLKSLEERITALENA